LAIKPKPGRGNGEEQEHSGKPEDTGDTRAGTGAEAETGAGCQDIEQAAACFPLPAGNRTTGLRHMSWIA